MSEKVEHVAWAIQRLAIEKGDCVWRDALHPDFVEYAHAAIEAMREPTEAMIQRSYLCDSLDAKEKWQAMIDEALR